MLVGQHNMRNSILRKKGRSIRKVELHGFSEITTLAIQWGSGSPVSLPLGTREMPNLLKERMQSTHQAGISKINLSRGAEPNLKFRDKIF